MNDENISDEEDNLMSDIKSKLDLMHDKEKLKPIDIEKEKEEKLIAEKYQKEIREQIKIFEKEKEEENNKKLLNIIIDEEIKFKKNEENDEKLKIDLINNKISDNIRVNPNSFSKINLKNRFDILNNEEDLEDDEDEKKEKNNKIKKKNNNNIFIDVPGHLEFYNFMETNEQFKIQVIEIIIIFLIVISNLILKTINNSKNILNDLTNLNKNNFIEFNKLWKILSYLRYNVPSWFKMRKNHDNYKIIKSNTLKNEEFGLKQLLDLLDDPNFYKDFWNNAKLLQMNLQNLVRNLDSKLVEAEPTLLMIKNLYGRIDESCIVWEILCSIRLENYFFQKFVSRKGDETPFQSTSQNLLFNDLILRSPCS